MRVMLYLWWEGRVVLLFLWWEGRVVLLWVGLGQGRALGMELLLVSLLGICRVGLGLVICVQGGVQLLRWVAVVVPLWDLLGWESAVIVLLLALIPLMGHRPLAGPTLTAC